MEEFNYEEWRRNKELEKICSHEQYAVEVTETTNGNPLRRFICTHCKRKDASLQLGTNDVDRKIPSVKHPGKTLQEIFETDAPYLHWVAVKSKMSQMDRYACARILLRKPYFLPLDGEVISKDDLYIVSVRAAIKFIRDNGGEI